METPAVLLVGVSDAGKTNFLARLWLAISRAESSIAIDGDLEDATYLREISEKLLEGKFVEHTPSGEYNRVAIPIKTKSSEVVRKGELIVPDLWGERIVEIYNNREWQDDFEELISESCSCLLFLRVDSRENIKTLDLIQCAHLWKSVGKINLEVKDRKRTPTEIVLVDWLQFLRRAFTDRVNGRMRPRIGIVLSAWDAVPNDENSSVELYLLKNFPVLGQFVQTNRWRFDFQCFGLSSTGGDLKADKIHARNFKTNPHKFGYVVHKLNGKSEKSTDLTIPIAWALGWRGDQTS